MWTRRCRRRRSPFPPTRVCITKRAVCWCGKPGAGIELRQSYKRVGKRALQKQGRYAHAQQLKRARRKARKVRTYLRRQRLLRDSASSRKRQGLPLRKETERHTETIATPAFSH